MNASQKNTTNAEMADHAYVSTLYKTAMADGSFVPLLTRLELFDSFSSETLFTKNACRIITGIRAEMS